MQQHQNDALTHTGYQAILYRRNNLQDRQDMDKLLANRAIEVVDAIYPQLGELIRLNNPGIRWNTADITRYIEQHIGSTPLYDYGTWAYYPWLNKIVHLLDEEEFIKVRTSRNIYKITPGEIAILRKKKVGIIGLSVGQSIAIAMAMERICGELRLADFDELELSNMNRLRGAVHDLGSNKALIAARQIAEQDPYLKVTCYSKGIDSGNIDQFFLENGTLNLLIEECDSIDMKVISRIKAKQYGVPVVMDTNDKGMLDVERFDLEPGRPLFHGRLRQIEGLKLDEIATKLKNLNIEEKVAYLVDIIGFDNVSDAMKTSLKNMNKTIVGWPQLASAVMLGGAMVTDVARRILLGKFTSSGRYFIDFDELIQDFKN